MISLRRNWTGFRLAPEPTTFGICYTRICGTCLCPNHTNINGNGDPDVSRLGKPRSGARSNHIQKFIIHACVQPPLTFLHHSGSEQRDRRQGLKGDVSRRAPPPGSPAVWSRCGVEEVHVGGTYPCIGNSPMWLAPAPDGKLANPNT